MSVHVDVHGSDDDVAVIERGLREFNIAHIGPSGELPVRMFLRDSDGNVVGGLVGHYKWKWIYVARIWVADDYRGKGHGTMLMKAVEDHAVRSECHGIHLDTFEYQARPFYEKLGYTLFGTLEGFPPGYRQYQLVKHLGGANPANESRQSNRVLLEDFESEYKRYRTLGEKSLARLSGDALNHVPAHDANSAAMIVHHMRGNLVSRFTDFLTSDGEKPWRQRDEEFDNRSSTHSTVNAEWSEGWGVLESALSALSDADLATNVVIRGQQLSVHAALTRSLAHVAYHVGQIVLLARTDAGADWESLSIPRGGTAAYNAKPTGERVAANKG